MFLSAVFHHTHPAPRLPAVWRAQSSGWRCCWVLGPRSGMWGCSIWTQVWWTFHSKRLKSRLILIIEHLNARQFMHFDWCVLIFKHTPSFQVYLQSLNIEHYPGKEGKRRSKRRRHPKWLTRLISLDLDDGVLLEEAMEEGLRGASFFNRRRLSKPFSRGEWAGLPLGDDGSCGGWEWGAVLFFSPPDQVTQDVAPLNSLVPHWRRPPPDCHHSSLHHFPATDTKDKQLQLQYGNFL